MQAYFDIDTQIDFLFPAGALYAPGAEKVLPAVAALNREAVTKGYALISTTCAHPENAEEFRVWPAHCVVGTVGQLKPAATLVADRVVIPWSPAQVGTGTAKQIILEKNELDLFSNPNLVPLLDRLGITECTIYGVLTEYCVRHAAMGLLATGRKVRLITNAIHHLSAEESDKMITAFISAGGVCDRSEESAG